jgi:polysaccharide biosynthesis protein PslG
VTVGPLARALATAVAVAAACAAPASASDFVGIYNDDAFFGSPSYRSSAFTAEAAVGIQIVRQPFDWSRIEIAPDEYDFRSYDDFVLRAATAGVRVLPVLGDPPSFRALGYTRDDLWSPPSSNAEFAAFAAKLVDRYGPDGTIWALHPSVPKLPIHSWQIWNEPNLLMFWNTGPDPVAYTAMLQAAHDAIHAEDPGAEVVAAGLPNSKVGTALSTFLDGMLNAGGASAFDTIAVHPYAADASHSLFLVEQTRALLAAHGNNAPIWITEDGWPTDGPRSPYTVSEEGQATQIGNLIAEVWARRAELGIRGLVIFRWRDAVSTFDAWPLHAGLVRADGSAKPGLAAFRDAVAALAVTPSPIATVPPGPAPRPATTPAVTPPIHRPRLVITGGALSRYGFLRVRVKCLAGACRGRVRTAKTRGLCTGSRRLALRAGAGAVVRVRLKGTRRQLQACKRVRVVASPGPPGGRSAALFRR